MKQSELSIIIPTLNAQEYLPRCLDSLSLGLGAGLIKDVIVVDGGSTDNTVLMASGSGCRVIACTSAGRGRQLRAGAKNAKGSWYLFLHADTALDYDWVDACRAHMMFPHLAAAFTLAYDSPSKHARWLENRVKLRVNTLGLPYGDQGLLIHSDLYLKIGGYSDIPLMEDVDIIRRIGKSRLRILKVQAITSADKYERDGWRKRSWSNALLLTRYLLGADPHELAKKYR